jgi:ketosteroid isomerase-like protein
VTGLNRIVISSLLVLMLVATQSCSPKPENRLKDFEKAYNAHDVEKIMSFYAEDAVHEVLGQFVLRGKEKIRGLVEYDAASDARLSFTQYEVEGQTITCGFTMTDDWIKAAGMDQIHYSGTLVFRDGLIHQWTAQTSSETVQRLTDVFNAVTDWASKERPQQLEELISQGDFVYNAENAKKSLELLREWQKATGQPD